MNNISEITIQQLENSLNHIFECQQKEAKLELLKATIDAEWVLLEHTVRAFQIIDRGTD
jgi:hypothetical protein